MLELLCCRKWQKSPYQETGLGNRGCLKVLHDTKLVLNEYEQNIEIKSPSLDHFVIQNSGDFLCQKYKEVVCYYVSNLRQ